MSDLAAAIERAIEDKMAGYMAQVAGLSAAPPTQAPPKPQDPSEAIAALKRALSTEGVNFIIRQPDQALGVLTQLVSLVEDLSVRVVSLERQNGDYQMLVSELKKRAEEKTA